MVKRSILSLKSLFGISSKLILPLFVFEIGVQAAPTNLVHVGNLELEVPSQAQAKWAFMGNLPIPPGTYTGKDLKTFAYQDLNGKTQFAQVVIVSFYPDREIQGASLVQIIGQTPVSQANLSQGVVTLPVYRTQFSSESEKQMFKSLVASVDPTFLNLVKSGLHISSKDVFGNTYRANLLDPAKVKFRFTGYYCNEFFISTTPTVDVKTADSLPHLYQVHVYGQYCAGDKALKLTLRFTNAFGNVSSSDLDDPVGDLVFDGIALDHHKNTKLVAFNPEFNTDYTSSSVVTLPDANEGRRNFVLKPLADGKQNYFKTSLQTTRRIALYLEGSDLDATDIVNFKRYALVKPGKNTSGEDLYSYNRQDLGWGVLRLPVPTDGLGFPMAQAKKDFDARYLKLSNAYVNNDATAISEFPSGIVGPFAFYFNSYINTGSGTGIYGFAGQNAAMAVAQSGIRYYAVMAQLTDTKIASVMRMDGSPAMPEDYLKTTSTGIQYVSPNIWTKGYQPGPADPLGWNAASTKHIHYATDNGLLPDYLPKLNSFLGEFPDLPHAPRAFHPAAALKYLINDAAADASLLQYTALNYFGTHPYGTNTSGSLGYSSITRLLGEVIANPHSSSDFLGREFGWLMVLLTMVYSTSDDPFIMKTYYTHLQRFIEFVELGQTCTGQIEGKDGAKMILGTLSKQEFEESFGFYGLFAVLKNVFPVSDSHFLKTAQVLKKMADFRISDMNWDPIMDAPYNKVAARDNVEGSKVYCSKEELPPGYQQENEIQENINIFSIVAHYSDPDTAKKFRSYQTRMLGGTCAKALKAVQYDWYYHNQDFMFFALWDHQNHGCEEP